MKALIFTLFLCASFGVGTAHAASNKASSTSGSSAAARKASAASRSECALSVGLCVTVPASWQRLGDVFDNLGFVVAEPHSGTEPATWPQLTVAALDVPPPKAKHGAAAAVPPSLDALIDLVLTPDGSFTSAETLQRTHLILNGGDAEIVRVRLHDDSNKPEAIEAIALIEGEDGLVYSIALRCAPEDFARLEPVFQKAAHSWRIKQAPTEQSKPKQDSQTK
jgi:hypothetical protein